MRERKERLPLADGSRAADEIWKSRRASTLCARPKESCDDERRGPRPNPSFVDDRFTGMLSAPEIFSDVR